MPRKKKPRRVEPRPSAAVGRELSSVHIGGKVFPARVLRISRTIAERMGTGFLCCDNCNRVQDLSGELMEKYLQIGLPVCCEGTPNGGTMRYCRAEERKRG